NRIDLYERLQKATEATKAVSNNGGETDELLVMAEHMLSEFENQGGINLAEVERQRLLQLQSDELRLSTRFGRNLTEDYRIFLPRQKLDNLPSTLVSHVRSSLLAPSQPSDPP